MTGMQYVCGLCVVIRLYVMLVSCQTPHADTNAADIMNNDSKDAYCAADKRRVAADFDDVVRGCCLVPHTLWCLL